MCVMRIIFIKQNKTKQNQINVRHLESINKITSFKQNREKKEKKGIKKKNKEEAQTQCFQTITILRIHSGSKSKRRGNICIMYIDCIYFVEVNYHLHWTVLVVVVVAVLVVAVNRNHLCLDHYHFDM